MSLEIYIKSVDEEIVVDDIQVSGSGSDAYVESVDAWFKGADISIEDEVLLQEICETLDNDYQEVVQEISFENAVCAAEYAMDSYYDR